MEGDGDGDGQFDTRKLVETLPVLTARGDNEDQLELPILEKDEEDQEGKTARAYKLLTVHQILEIRQKLVENVNNVIKIDEDSAQLLLSHSKWDEVLLLERYYSADRDRLFEAAGAKKGVLKSLDDEKEAENKVCEICLLEILTTSYTGLACGHTFCTSCWEKHASLRIMSQGGSDKSIECMNSQCHTLASDRFVLSLLKDDEVKSRFQLLMANDFLKHNHMLRWCPGPDCEDAIKASRLSIHPSQPVRCQRGHVFCFDCTEDWHFPLSCESFSAMMHQWQDETATLGWLIANTKQCPKCPYRFEEVEEEVSEVGHVIVCVCEAEFCSRCLQEPHPDQLQCLENCGSNPFDHYNMYRIYKAKLHAAMEAPCTNEATAVLCDCFRTLLLTYVFTYFLQKNYKTMLLEFQQQELESFVDLLSRSISGSNPSELDWNLRNQYMGVCKKRRRLILGQIQEGYQKRWWEFTGGLEQGPKE